MKNTYFFSIVLILFSIGCVASELPETTSPDKSIRVQVGLENNRVFYSVTKNKLPVLNKSFLGFTFKDGDFSTNFRITDVKHDAFSEKWNQVWGEEITVDNTYNEMTVFVEETVAPKRKFSIVFRLFDDGFGFRYEFPKQKNLDEFIIMDELTEFALTDNHKTWSIPYDIEAYEAIYRSMPVNELDTVCSPLTMETPDGLFLSIHEANLTDYAAMNLHPVNQSSTLKAYLTPWSTGEKVFVKDTRVTPWRTVIIAEKPEDLALSRLMLNLNEPCKIEDTSWIKPSKYIGIWWGMHMKYYTWDVGPTHGATTENTKRYIDFAAANNISGVLVEGWNKGWNDWQSFSYTQAYPDFDLKEVAEYAAKKGVKLIGHHETGGHVYNYEPQLEDAFALYNELGIDAVKTGYVGTLLNGKEMHSGQFAVRHYRKVIETAAKYRIMIDNHEPVMPTGLSRTYPNIMTFEGVRGQEWDAWDKTTGGNPPSHTAIIPFTRGLAGPMDYTPVAFNFDNPAVPESRINTTLAKQLALFVVLYSPLQMASDMIENYEKNPEPFQFITSCPVDWSKTIMPEAKIGEYVTIARKDKGSENWYVGSITNENSRQLNLPLDFLDDSSSYKAIIYKDGKDAEYKDNPYSVEIEEMEVNSKTILSINQATSGGTAIQLIKLNEVASEK